MENKKLAKDLIRSIFADTKESNPIIHIQKKSYLIPFEGNVTKRFIKIASSTYVNLEEPEKVWRLEVLEGKPYIVALEKSNIIQAEDYDVHEAVQGVMLYKGDKVIANIPLPPTADAKTIAERLKEKVASLSHLPPKLLIDVVTKEASSLSNTFVDIKTYHTKVAELSPKSKLYDELHKIKFPSNIGERFELAISKIKGDKSKVNLIQNIVNSFKNVLNKIRSKMLTIKNKGDISEEELNKMLREFGIGLEDLGADILKTESTIQRLVTAKKPTSKNPANKKPTNPVESTVSAEEEFRALFADLFLTLGKIKENLLTIVKQLFQSSGGVTEKATDFLRRVTPKGEYGAPLSLLDQLAVIHQLSLLPSKEEPQAVYEVMKNTMLSDFAPKVEELQQVLTSKAAETGTFSEIVSELNKIIKQTKDSSTYILKLSGKYPNNKNVQTYFKKLFFVLKDYLDSSKLLSDTSSSLRDSLSTAYKVTTKIFVNLPSGENIGNVLNLALPGVKDVGLSYSISSKWLDLFEKLYESIQTALSIADTSSKGDSNEEKELVALQPDLKKASILVYNIIQRMTKKLSEQIPAETVLKELSSEVANTRKLGEFLADALSLASVIDPNRLSPQVVSTILTSVLPALIDPTFAFKESSLSSFIKVSYTSASVLDELITRINKFYDIWNKFKDDAYTFIVVAEQGRSLFGHLETEEEEEESFWGPIHQFYSEPLPVAASLKRLLKKSASPESLNVEQIADSYREAIEMLRFIYKKMYEGLNSTIPRKSVIKALKDIGITDVENVVEALPDRMYGKFLAVLLGNLGKLFNPEEAQVATPSAGSGSVQVVTEYPRTPSTETATKSKRFLSSLGIPEEYIDFLSNISHPMLEVSTQLPKDVREEISKSVPSSVSPITDLPFKQRLEIFPEVAPASVYIPSMGWETFDRLYKGLRSTFESLGSTLEEQVVSLYQAVKSPAGSQLISTLKNVELAAPLYFYETQKKTAKDVMQLSDDKISQILAQRGIQASPTRVKAIAQMYFFRNEDQAKKVIKEWEKHIKELSTEYSTPLKMIKPSLQERAKKYFSKPNNLTSFLENLSATGVYQFESIKDPYSEKAEKLRTALKSGDIVSALSLFSGRAAYILREQLDKVLSDLNK